MEEGVRSKEFLRRLQVIYSDEEQKQYVTNQQYIAVISRRLESPLHVDDLLNVRCLEQTEH